MTNETATPQEMEAFLDGITPEPWLKEQAQFAAIGALGMCRHAYLSPDWVAHNALYASAANRLPAAVSERIATHYNVQGDRGE